MKLYITIIAAAMTLIAGVNLLLHTASWYGILAGVVICTALQFALDGLLAVLINKMPNAWFGVDNSIYRVSEREKRLYKKLKVRAWKDQVWELGGLGGFSKKCLEDPDSPAYMERFIIECNKGVLTHRLSYFVGFLGMLLFPNICAFTIALPVAAVNLFLNILPTLVLRYNTPKLQLVLERMRRKQAQKKSTVV